MTIPAREYEDLLKASSRLAEIEAQQRKDLAEAQRREFEAKVEKGQVKEALDTLRAQSAAEIEAERKRYRETEDRAKRYARDGELARVLAKQSLVPYAADHLTRLWQAELTVEAHGESFAVWGPGMVSVEQYVAQQLQRPEYLSFVRAATQGGTGGQATQAAGNPGQPQQQTIYPTTGHVYLDRLSAPPPGARGGTGDPQTDASIPFGLKRSG